MGWQAFTGEIPPGPWLFIDLACQRLVSNDLERLPREPCAFQRDEGDWEPSNPVVWCNVPPWWEQDVQARLEADAAPLPPPSAPVDFRGVLYGRAMAEAIADLMRARQTAEGLPAAFVDLEGGRAERALDDQERQLLHRWRALTNRVHADWLLAARADLEHRPPRHFLHAGREWVDQEIEHRQRQWSLFRAPPLPLEHETHAYRHGPMGTAEVVVYFDFCRQVIAAGWRHLCDSKADGSATLADVLYDAGVAWLQAGRIDDDPTPPAAIIESCRRHMPMVANKSEHLDCDCPICRMMAEQSDSFGPAFFGFDGHHLELDDEFAFSLCETRDEWESQRCDDDFDVEDWDEPDSLATRPPEDDDLASVWKSSFVADIPGGGVSTMALAFRAAELVSDLEMTPDSQAQIDHFNQLFDAVRHAEDGGSKQRRERVVALREYLERLAGQHPVMTGKIADFQSQLDAWIRQPATGFSI